MRQSIQERDHRKYYDRYEYDRLCKLMKLDIYAAKEGFEEYLLKYNKDISAHLRYVNLLITTGELEQAKEYISIIENKLNKISVYNSLELKRNEKHKSLLVAKARLYSYLDRPWDSLRILINNREIFNEDIKYSIFYLRKLVNHYVRSDDRGNGSYIYRQMADYKEEELIEHIKRHEADYNMNDKEISTSFFVPDFPVEKVIEEVKNNMKKENSLNKGIIANSYFFKYDQCGRSKDKLTDFFEVITFKDTKDIITMYPVLVVKNRNYVDLNNLIEKKEYNNQNVKRLSQIDKFNRRYKNISL